MCEIYKWVRNESQNDPIRYPTIMLSFDLKIQINALFCMCMFGAGAGGSR